jgi:hypothetical protein
MARYKQVFRDEAKFKNDQTGASAYDPRTMFKIVLLGLSPQVSLVAPQSSRPSASLAVHAFLGKVVQRWFLTSRVVLLSTTRQFARMPTLPPHHN